jgi:hypothetical protein
MHEDDADDGVQLTLLVIHGRGGTGMSGTYTYTHKEIAKKGKSIQESISLLAV